MGQAGGLKHGGFLRKVDPNAAQDGPAAPVGNTFTQDAGNLFPPSSRSFGHLTRAAMPYLVPSTRLSARLA